MFSHYDSAVVDDDVKVDATTAPPAMRQISDNTFLKVVSQAFIPETELSQLLDHHDQKSGQAGDESWLDGAVASTSADEGGGLMIPDTGGGGGESVEEPFSSYAVSVSGKNRGSSDTSLNKRQAKAAMKKASMTPEEYAKYAAYREKNNVSVALSRKRKRHKLKESEARVEELMQDKALLVDRIAELEAEVKSLMTMLIKKSAREPQEQ